ncbi:hypothetical protein AMS68_006905 [Peltaster fructicola]|uniref:Acyltransferase 3 domain-containing protein n=1 Tax=Peltaster fructicola TaxID=286661 RepID=A0A6H0Y3H0_9PEZI|nr:hypothetical protein AMS68_006905 [Peltaster fructicola]
MDGLLAGERPQPSRIIATLTDLFTPDAFSRRPKPKRVGPTGWLDGLRGWAALCVAFMHLTVYTHEGLELCYGSKFRHSDQLNTSFAALPIIRLPFTGGHFAVMLFFVISGYVVPRRLSSMLHEGRREEFIESVHSAIIRRPVRLFAPVFMSTLFLCFFWHITGISVPWPVLSSNIIFEIGHWLEDMGIFLYYHKVGPLYSIYNVHTWTIPVEFRGSMFLFIFLFATSHIKTKTRTFMELAVTLHLSIGSPGAWYACFFAGMFMSDLELLALENNNITFPWDPIDQWLRAKPQKVLRFVLLHVLLLCSLYLATQPSADWTTKAETLGNCPGWMTLSAMIPRSYLDDFSQFRWFWLFWAAWAMVYCVREIGWLRACFETSVAQYLGKHSFALYLVHGPIIAIFAERLFYLTGLKQAWQDEQKITFGMYQNKWRDSGFWPFSANGSYGLEPTFLACVAITLPLMLYLAEVGTRAFDLPSVTLSRWVWQKWKNL